MPWLTVSCAGQPLAKANGFGLAFGQFELSELVVGRELSAPPVNPLLIVSIIAILVGLYLLYKKPDKTPLLSLCLSLFTAFCLALGMTRYTIYNILTATSGENVDHQAYERANALIQINYGSGMWVSIGCLLIAAAFAFAAMREEHRLASDAVPLPVTNGPSTPTAPPTVAEADPAQDPAASPANPAPAAPTPPSTPPTQS